MQEAIGQGKASGDGWLARLLQARFGFTPGSPTPLLETHPEYWADIAARYHKFGSLHEDILGHSQRRPSKN